MGEGRGMKYPSAFLALIHLRIFICNLNGCIVSLISHRK